MPGRDHGDLEHVDAGDVIPAALRFARRRSIRNPKLKPSVPLLTSRQPAPPSLAFWSTQPSATTSLS
jgi:hypothetical protein